MLPTPTVLAIAMQTAWKGVRIPWSFSSLEHGLFDRSAQKHGQNGGTARTPCEGEEKAYGKDVMIRGALGPPTMFQCSALCTHLFRCHRRRNRDGPTDGISERVFPRELGEVMEKWRWFFVCSDVTKTSFVRSRSRVSYLPGIPVAVS
jgi:hypothetical protein